MSTEEKNMEDLDLEAQIAATAVKDAVLMYLLKQQGGELKILPAELDSFQENKINMSVEEHEGGPELLCFKLLKA